MPLPFAQLFIGFGITAISDRREYTEGTVIEFISSDIPGKIRQGPVQERGVHARLCLFFPRLDPVLDRGKGHNDPVVAPEVPTRGPVGQAVFDHEPHGEVYHAVGVLTAGWRQIREVGVKVLATLRTEVLRIGDDEIAWTPEVEIAQVVQRPLKLLVPIGGVPAAWTWLPLVAATIGDDLWWGQVCNRGNPFGGIGSIRTRTEHGCGLLARIG